MLKKILIANRGENARRAVIENQAAITSRLTASPIFASAMYRS